MAPEIIAFGVLDENGDTWFLRRPQDFLLLDLDLADMSLKGKVVSVGGRMGPAPDAPGIIKLLVARLATHEAIAKRAYALFQSGAPGTAQDHWLEAERELLGM